MKFIILTFAVLLPFFVSAQTAGFSIYNKIGNLNKEVAIYLDYHGKAAGDGDSAAPVNGTFSFAGTINGVYPVRITLDYTRKGKRASVLTGGDNIYFYFSTKNMTVTSNGSPINAQLKGTLFCDEYAANNKTIGAPINVSLAEIFKD